MTSHTPENRGGGNLRRGRRRAAALAAAVLSLGGLAGGCQTNTPVQKEPADPPFIVDQAMLRRDWPQSTMTWANADLVGWPIRFPLAYDVSVQRPFPQSRSIDTLLFFYQVFQLPFTYIKEAPFQRKLYTSGVKYDPTFEAMPALPSPVGGGAGQNEPPPESGLETGTPNGRGGQGTPGGQGGNLSPGANSPNTPGNPAGTGTPGGITPGTGTPGGTGTGTGGTGTGSGTGGTGTGTGGTGTGTGGTGTGGTGSGGTGTGSPGGTGTGSPGGTGTGGTGTGTGGGTGGGSGGR